MVGPGRRNSAHEQKTAWCQWVTDRHSGMLVLCGLVFGPADGVPHSGV